MQNTFSIKKTHFAGALLQALSLIVLILVVWHYVVSAMLTSQQEENMLLDILVVQKKAELAMLLKREQTVGALTAQVTFLTELRQHNYQVVQALNKLTQVFPATTLLQELQRQGSTVKVRGEAQTDLELVHLMQNIANSGLFRQPVITEISARNQSRTFQLKMDMSG